jgi:hypothetical protein
MNLIKFKRLGIRKIKCEMVEDPGYPFALDIIYYDRSTGGINMYFSEYSFTSYNSKFI